MPRRRRAQFRDIHCFGEVHLEQCALAEGKWNRVLRILPGLVAAVMCLLDRTRGGREKVAAVVGSLIALAGVPAYIGWVGLRVGDLDAWFKIQTADWGTTFDYGRSTWDFVTTTVHTGAEWVAISVVLILTGLGWVAPFCA